MKVALQSTSKIIMLVINGVEVPARIWEGQTSGGIPCHAFITRVAAGQRDRLDEFERDLTETTAPSPDVSCYPARMIL